MEAKKDSGFHRWFTGFFLLVLMLAFLFVNAWVFSARSFQDNFAKISGNGSGVVSTQAIINAKRTIAEIELQQQPDEQRLDILNRQLDSATIAFDKVDAQLIDQAKLLSAKVSALETKTPAANATQPGDNSYTGVIGRVDHLAQTAGIDQTELATLTAQAEQLSALNDQVVAAEDAKKKAEADARALQASLSDSRQRLLTERTQFGEHFDQIQTEIESLQASSPLGIGAWFAQVHPAFLSVMLVCFMGALGSMLYLFPAYIANHPGQQVTFESIIVRTAFGIVVAFAFYIVANVGIAVFGVTSGAGAPAANTSLNPFTAAGLGIVAGVMGDDVARWIHDRGAYLFKTAGDGAGLGGITGAFKPSQAPTPPIQPTQADLPSGGLVNPHGGPQDTP